MFWFFIIGALLGNGMPHFIWGISKVVARSPFGQKSRPFVNVRWGLANFIVATLLALWRVKSAPLSHSDVLALLVGFWLAVAQFGFGIKRFLNPPDRT